jgi:lathosterol oxidase
MVNYKLNYYFLQFILFLLGVIPFLKEFVGFLCFTDMLIYFIHRGLHHRLVYKHSHKLHHRWIVPTPFASHAFQWLDGFLQSSPYHLYVFLFPLHKLAYLFFFLFVNFWTVSIHDGNYSVPKLFQPFLNGAAHHNDHHQYYDCNYGQFFTFWDRLMCSFRMPAVYEDKKKNID